MIIAISRLKRLVLIASLFATTCQSAGAQNQLELGGEDLCGPTCVAHVTEAYGLHVSLQEVMDRKQSGQSNLPWSLKNICDSLGEHGVFGKCVRIEDVSSLQWPWPVVLHMHRSPTQEKGLPPTGHFVVLFPEAPNRSRPILDGTDWYSLQQIASRTSGAAILTAPSQKAFLTEMTPHYGLIALATLVLLVFAALLARHFARKNPKPFGVPSVRT
jgi:hypothetical protein